MHKVNTELQLHNSVRNQLGYKFLQKVGLEGQLRAKSSIEEEEEEEISEKEESP